MPLVMLVALLWTFCNSTLWDVWPGWQHVALQTWAHHGFIQQQSRTLRVALGVPCLEIPTCRLSWLPWDIEIMVSENCQWCLQDLLPGLYLPVLTSALCRHGLDYFFLHVSLCYSSLEASRDLLETLLLVQQTKRAQYHPQTVSEQNTLLGKNQFTFLFHSVRNSEGFLPSFPLGRLFIYSFLVSLFSIKSEKNIYMVVLYSSCNIRSWHYSTETDLGEKFCFGMFPFFL